MLLSGSSLARSLTIASPLDFVCSGGSVYDQMVIFQERQKANAVDSELEQLEFTETQKRTGATALLGGLAFMHSRGVAAMSNR